MVSFKRKCFITRWWYLENKLWLVHLCILKTSIKMLIIFYSINFFKIWKRWIWKNWNNSILSLCCKKSKLISNKNLNFFIWCSLLWLFKRKRPWKLYFWINAYFSIAWKTLRSILSILCDNCSKKIFLLSWSQKNWKNNDKRHANKPYLSWALWIKILNYELRRRNG